MDKSRGIPIDGNSSEHESDSDVDVVGIEEMVEEDDDDASCTDKSLERIIGEVEHPTKRKNEAWKLRRTLKAEYEARWAEYEEKMLEAGRTFQAGSPNTRAIEGEPPQALEFSECFSEGSADIADCEDGDVTDGNSMSSFESEGANTSDQETDGESLDSIGDSSPGFEVTEEKMTPKSSTLSVSRILLTIDPTKTSEATYTFRDGMFIVPQDP